MPLKKPEKAPDAERSRVMRAVKAADTRPEMLVRKLLHGMGYRFRLHRKDLPGSPDLVFPGRRKVIFIHGCFWHGHECPRGARTPAANADYWRSKIGRNVARDAASLQALHELGWRPLVIWECQLKQRDRLELVARLKAFLDVPASSTPFRAP